MAGPKSAGKLEDPPISIDPYAVLCLNTDASAAQVKSAYKKLALQNHPGISLSKAHRFNQPNTLIDKVAPSDRDTAHVKFQEIAFAYAILSDERRRKRYDTTGSTSESLDLDDSDFDWGDFFRTQYAELVTIEKIDHLKSSYQNSEEEARDVLQAYINSKGKMQAIFRTVMLSDDIEDEDRFRAIIDAAIARNEVDAYDAYVNETKKSKQGRQRQARKEAKAAEIHAKKLGLHEKVFGGGRAGGTKMADAAKKGGDEASLEALIQKRGQGRATAFLEDLEAKYAGGTKTRKRKAHEEPGEEAFAKMAERQKSGKAAMDARRAAAGTEENQDEDIVESAKPTRGKRGKRAKIDKPEPEEDDGGGGAMEDAEEAKPVRKPRRRAKA
jgi:DnaJ family protein C protein 9